MPNNCKGITFWYSVISQSKVFRSILNRDLGQLRICSVKLISFLETNLELSQERSLTINKLLKCYSRNLRGKQLKYSHNLINLEMVKNLLKCIPNRQLRKCQRGTHKRDQSHQLCSSKFFNSLVLKMKLYRAMKMVILILFSWDRCPPMTSRKWYLTRII